MRDFRINVNTLKTRVEQNESDDQPIKKKRRATQSMGGGDEQENEEDATRTSAGDETSMDVGERDTSQQSVVF
ncbi:unnamed protein product [Nippostrongylus brasiliensis]|uniref:Uncharacterized protein n=1 Tax=Nippostrongylus brasiliensis TaxID=27835 RepID=A0A0N4XPD3_NIPBR|nr:unnamed protein product [Nippostrongylus brasiliensis]